jgi:hypothetical protein
MKKESNEYDDDMLPEYDFSKMGEPVQGKYHEAYKAGHTVKIHKEDGTVEVHYFMLEDGSVLIEPDIRPYFPDSKTVNHALRTLISLIPRKQQETI